MTRLARFPQYSVFAAMLAFAGLPLYIHAPKFFADEYGVSLTLLGVALLAVRGIDFVQDPLLGWLSDRVAPVKSKAVFAAGGFLALGMLMLFAVPADFAPLTWFVICLVVMFTAFSFLSISFYAQGVHTATQTGSSQAHGHLAAWREGGALIGICIAAALPSLLQTAGVAREMAIFAFVFAAIVLIALAAMRLEWSPTKTPPAPISEALGDKTLRQLMVLAILNSAPVAVSSTLFLFFVGDRLGSDSAGGLLLILFFLSAAASVPLWSMLARRQGMKATLQWGMGLAIFAFAWALALGEGDFIAFGIICALSGAALGADMTFLPALFARRIDQAKMPAGLGFGLWNFCSKLSLAIAAAVALPALEAFGFATNTPNSDQSLWALTLLYAGLPCILKVGALAYLTRIDLGDPR